MAEMKAGPIRLSVALTPMGDNLHGDMAPVSIDRGGIIFPVALNGTASEIRDEAKKRFLTYCVDSFDEGWMLGPGGPK